MTGASSLAAVRGYARALTAKFRTLGNAQPEDQLKTPVERLLGDLGTIAEVTVGVNTEHRVDDVGRPDMAVSVDRLLCGFVELKAPETGADPRRFRGRNREQWAKFQALPNLIYTDGVDWALFRGGEQAMPIVRLPGDVSRDDGADLDEASALALLRLVRDFLSWQPIVPSGPRALAEQMAPLCHLLRDDVQAALRDPASALSQLASEWRSTLFPEADDRQFADAYAQTLTYALLLARLSGSDLGTTEGAASALRPRHHLLAQVLTVLAQPGARAEIAVGVDLLERTIAAVDPAALARGSSDPWLYFYEDFLAAYDPDLRNARGVYYTPVEVVKAQVALVADLLRSRLGKPLAFADSGVLLLDPATGTGTYPLTALQHGLDAVADAYGPGEHGAAASRMAENIHAFELLVGPYAVAHLRLSERVIDAGGALPPDGARVFLTDTLESPHASPPGQITLQSRELVEEHRRALAVKRDTPILVCIGNPPYDREQRSTPGDGERRKGGWVRHGEPGDPEDRALLADFLRPAREAGAGVHLKNLYNDYVYFWRWALWKVFESKPGPGIVSFITASSYLRGPGFVGMREAMRRAFDELWILDLEGDNRGTRRTDNVFDIQTPVAIAVGARFGAGEAERPATVRYAKLEGSRADKLAALAALDGFADLAWSPVPDGWQNPFLPVGVGDYFAWPLLTDLFPWQQPGVKVGRSWPIGTDRATLAVRWHTLARASGLGRQRLFKDSPTGRKSADRAPQTSPLPVSQVSIATMPPDASPPTPVRYAFRSFDRMWILRDGRLIDRPAPALWNVAGSRQLYLTSLLTGTLGGGPAATVAGHVPDLHHFRGSFGGKDVIPLWRDAAATEPNVTAGLLDVLTDAFGEPVAPEDLFAYAVAVLGGSGYADRFADELATPGPRLPLTRDGALFRRGVALGRELVALQTYGDRFPDALPGGTVPRGDARSLTGIPAGPDGYPDEFSYDEPTRELRVGDGRFGPVAPEVWAYAVSGLSVVRSWLGYRMRRRSGRSSSPLDDIRPERWTLEMTTELLELLWVLEAIVAREPDLRGFLDEVVAGSVFSAEDLPAPTPAERAAPAAARPSSARQTALALDG